MGGEGHKEDGASESASESEERLKKKDQSETQVDLKG